MKIKIHGVLLEKKQIALILYLIAIMSALQASDSLIVLDRQLTYKRLANHTVFSFTVLPNELVNPDPTPFIRIFGNGRVIVHYPGYMKKAGDYSLLLGENEIEELLDIFLKYDLLKLDHIKINQAKKAYDLKLHEQTQLLEKPGIINFVADADTIRIDYALTQVHKTSNGKGMQEELKTKQITYTGLKADSERYPYILQIQGVSQLESWFKKLAQRDELKNIPK